MKTITIRDLRQKWPAAEQLLLQEGELIITRDSVPVARLVRYEAKPKKRKPFDRAEHQRALKRIWGDQTVQLVDKYLAIERADR